MVSRFSKNSLKVRKQNKGPGGKSAKKTTLKRLKRKTKSRASSVSSQESDSCSSCSSVTSNSSNSIASRAEKIGKVWQTNKGALFSSLFFVAGIETSMPSIMFDVCSFRRWKKLLALHKCDRVDFCRLEFLGPLWTPFKPVPRRQRYGKHYT